MKRFYLLAILVCVFVAASGPVHAGAVRYEGFNFEELKIWGQGDGHDLNDSEYKSFGFPFQFFDPGIGHGPSIFSGGYVNANGSLSFEFENHHNAVWTIGAQGKIISPFISGHCRRTIYCGQGMVDGKKAFAVTWSYNGIFVPSATFQLVLIDESALGTSSFELNYDAIDWTNIVNSFTDGSKPMMGFSNEWSQNSNTAYYQMPLNGGYLPGTDIPIPSGLAWLPYYSLNSMQEGRYVFYTNHIGGTWGPGGWREGSLPPYQNNCPYDPPGCSCGRQAPGQGGLQTNDAQGAGPSSNDPVNLATGTEIYSPAPDLDIYNPTGERVIFARSFFSSLAYKLKSSPGLSMGWVHNYDVRVTAQHDSARQYIELRYPKGSLEYLTAENPAPSAPCTFVEPPGAEYLATGIVGATVGQYTKVTLTWRDGTVWEFTPSTADPLQMVLTKITNKMGRYLTLAYDANRKLTTVTNDVDTVLLTCAYNTDGMLESITDAYDRQVCYTYTIQFPARPMWPILTTVSQIVTAGTQNPPMRYTFSYWLLYTSSPGALHTITVPSPTGTGTQTATINYDDDGRVSSRVDANGNQRVYTYNGNDSSLVQVKNSGGIMVQGWTQHYNQLRNTGATDANNKGTVQEYGDTTKPYSPTRVKGKDGNATTYTYDDRGNILTATESNGVTTTYAYDYSHFDFGRLISIHKGTHTPTTYTYYEPSGLVHTITEPRPGSTTGETVTLSYTYDSLGNLLTETRPGNNATASITITYNYTTDGTYQQAAAIRQPLTITNALGHTVHYRYDARGNRIQVVDPLGLKTEQCYNIADHLTEVKSYEAGTGTIYKRNVLAYLYVGSPCISETIYDGANTQLRQVQSSYDVEGNLLTQSGDVEAVSYTYDTLGRKKTVTDGKNNTTTYSYDAVGNLVQVTYPMGDTVRYISHDEAGRVLEQVDGNNIHTMYEYNGPQGEMTKIHYPASPALDVTFTYTTEGRRLSMTDSTGIVTYQYDESGLPLSVTTHYTGLDAKTISYTYYPNGSRQSMTLPIPGGGNGTIHYRYDAGGRITRLITPKGKTARWQYDLTRQRIQQTLGNQAWTRYMLNNRGELIRQTNYSPKGRVLSDFTDIQYDDIGNCTQFNAVFPGLPTYSGTTTYNYSSKGQLLQELSSRNGGYSRDYTYDAAQNPTLFAGVAYPNYNGNNQLNQSGFTYNGNGNPTVYKGDHLTFDPENRLTEYRNENQEILLIAGYNGNGLRASKEDGLEEKKYYLYDGEKLVAILNDSGETQTVMTWGPTGLIASNDTWYQYDLQGSVVHYMDVKGKVLSNSTYDAWGSLVDGERINNYGYNAQEGYYTDNESGITLCTYRYYDADLGRWLTRDPISYEGGLNLYCYTSNHPVNNDDPLGLIWRKPDFTVYNINGGYGVCGGVSYIVDACGKHYLCGDIGIGISWPLPVGGSVKWCWFEDRVLYDSIPYSQLLEKSITGLGFSTTISGFIVIDIGRSISTGLNWKCLGVDTNAALSVQVSRCWRVH